MTGLNEVAGERSLFGGIYMLAAMKAKVAVVVVDAE